LLNSRLYNNHANFYGGAIGNYGALSIFTSTLDTNSAVTRGGGVYNYEGGLLDIEQSTLSGNASQSGGGIYSELFVHNNGNLVLSNSTLSGNSASQDGGGIYAAGGTTKLFNTTIANNQVLVPTGTTYNGLGGGMYVTGPAIVDGQNMLLADNTHQYGALPTQQDDCSGTLASLGDNMIETTTNCTISGTTSGNITGQVPLLGPLTTNGGLTLTQSPLAGSPAIDAGQTPSCTGVNGAPMLTDQRGFRRPIGARCDIGAVEYSPYALYLPLLRR
jgi:parallel beta-helix repeat protein